MLARAAALMLVATAFAGCISASQEPLQAAALRDWFPEDVVWDTAGNFSRPFVQGVHEVLPVEVLDIASFDGTRIQSAVWRPAVPEGQKVPVILEIGPYWGDGIDQMTPDYFEHQFFLEGIVPHGFAYARVAVRGTAGSGGCMEFFSLNEQRDMDSIVTFYGTQPWSNGNVGLWGGSYDGTTQWMAAMFGNPHLKTIVPISGLTSIYDHAFPNGTAWNVGPVFHLFYWEFGFETASRGAEEKVANALCPESWRGVANGPYTAATGEYEGPGPFEGYWRDRDFRERVLENYRGSVFLIHGLEDWRVPPHMAFPFLNELEDRGVATKVLLGQWWHDLPDNSFRRDHIRWDHAEVLLRWFQRWLEEDASVATGPAVDVEDSEGKWRTEARWPPLDASWSTYHLGAGELAAEPTPAGEQVLASPANAAQPLGYIEDPEGRPVLTEYRARLFHLEEDLRFAGAPLLHATFVPSSPEGARITAELIDVGAYGRERVVAHAVMDLRYHEGTHERHRLQPGEPIVARMQFFPADVHIPEGHDLVLRIANGVGYQAQRWAFTPVDGFVEHPTPLPVTLQWGEGKSVLVLPEIQRDVGLGTYPGQP